MADNPTDPGTPPAPEPAKGAPLEQRVGAIETEQQRQGGLLEQVLNAVKGGGTKADPAPAAPAGLSVAEQVRRGVEEIEAKKQADAAAQQAKDADAAWRSQVEAHVAEHRPAEPRTGRKVKLQERLFGRADVR